MNARYNFLGILILLTSVLPSDIALAADANVVQSMVTAGKVTELKALGQDVLPVMARLYEAADVSQRTRIAQAFYVLGWKSPDAKRVLIKDVHTPNPGLRLQVQWALGRVSNDSDVVDTLLKPGNLDDVGSTYGPVMGIMILGSFAGAIIDRRSFHKMWVVVMIFLTLAFGLGLWADIFSGE